MPRKLDEKVLWELYQKMLAAQNKKQGFALTYAEIQEAWGYSKKSKSMATYYLPLMEERGYVKSSDGSHGKVYLAVNSARKARLF